MLCVRGCTFFFLFNTCFVFLTFITRLSTCSQRGVQLCRPASIHLHPTNNAEDAVVFGLCVGEAFQHTQSAAPLAKAALQSLFKSVHDTLDVSHQI
jgi:hypothetical protein